MNNNNPSNHLRSESIMSSSNFDLGSEYAIAITLKMNDRMFEMVFDNIENSCWFLSQVSKVAIFSNIQVNYFFLNNIFD